MMHKPRVLGGLSMVCLSLSGCATVRSTAITGLSDNTPILVATQSDPEPDPCVFTPTGNAERDAAAIKACAEHTARGAAPPPAAQSSKLIESAGSGGGAKTRKSAVTSEGIAYFLPRQLALVTVKRSEVELSKLIKALGESEVALVEAKGAVAGAKAQVAAAKAAIIDEGGATNDTVRKLLGERLAAAEAAVTKATEAEGEAAKKRDEDKAKLEAAAGKAKVEAAKEKLAPVAAVGTAPAAKEYAVSLKVTLQQPSADPRHAFRLSPRHSVLRDDEHKIVVSPAGLLTSSAIVAHDRTGDILVELATFAGAIFTGPGPRGGTPDKSRPCTNTPNELSALIDFADETSVTALNEKMKCLGIRFAYVSGHWTAKSQPLDQPRVPVEGFVYRTPIEVLISVEKCTSECFDTGENWFPSEVIALSLPQAGPISYVGQDGGFMTRTTYDLAFKDGILTSYDSKRPSDLLAVASTPMRILNGVFDGASKIISLRTGRNDDWAKLTTSELAMLQASYNLQAGALGGDKQLTEAQLALLQAQLNLQAGGVTGAKQLTEAQLALLQAQLNLQAAGITGAKQLSEAELAVLLAGTSLSTGRNTAATQVSASDLATMIALLRDAAQRDAINKCIGEKVLNGEPITSCLGIP